MGKGAGCAHTAGHAHSLLLQAAMVESACVCFHLQAEYQPGGKPSKLAIDPFLRCPSIQLAAASDFRALQAGRGLQRVTLHVQSVVLRSPALPPRRVPCNTNRVIGARDVLAIGDCSLMVGDRLPATAQASWRGSAPVGWRG